MSAPSELWGLVSWTNSELGGDKDSIIFTAFGAFLETPKSGDVKQQENAMLLRIIAAFHQYVVGLPATVSEDYLVGILDCGTRMYIPNDLVLRMYLSKINYQKGFPRFLYVTPPDVGSLVAAAETEPSEEKIASRPLPPTTMPTTAALPPTTTALPTPARAYAAVVASSAAKMMASAVAASAAVVDRKESKTAEEHADTDAPVRPYCNKYRQSTCHKGDKCPDAHYIPRNWRCNNCKRYGVHTVGECDQPCTYYRSTIGCRNGDECPLLHV